MTDANLIITILISVVVFIIIAAILLTFLVDWIDRRRWEKHVKRDRRML